MQQAPRFVLAARLRCTVMTFFVINSDTGCVRIVGETHVAIGEDAAKLRRQCRIGAALDDGNAGNAVVLHQRQGVGERRVGKRW